MTGSLGDSLTSNSPHSDRYFDVPASGGRLAGSVRPVASLWKTERVRLLYLMKTFYANVTLTTFYADLDEKEDIILMTDAETGAIQGFSTLMTLRTTVNGTAVMGLFSGDTIIHRDYWGETILSRLWARYAFGLAATITDARTYWFLISSGYKTYRFLPTFFHDFYPRHDQPTPPHVRAVLDTFAHHKYPDEYDAERGVVRLKNPSPLRDNVATITPRRLKDLHVAYFVEANPGHADGDELACITEITPDNLTPAGRRMLYSE